METSSSIPTFAYMSQGRLFLKRPDADAVELTSDFAQGVIDRQQRDVERNAWKSDEAWGAGSPLGGIGFGGMQQWQASEHMSSVRFQTVCRGAAGELMYVLQMGSVHGVFRYAVDDKKELRLLHREHFYIEHLARHADEELFAMSVRQENGGMRLSTSEERVRPTNHISGGDTVDEAPSWAADGSKRLVFQSAPVGRNQNGMPVGLGPHSIELLDVDRGKVETIVEGEDRDFLLPKIDARNRLYYVRRPYKQQQAPAPSILEILKDIVLFPYRLVRALFYFFNFLSMIFAGRPLAESVDLKRTENQQQFMRLWGQVIDTKRKMDKPSLSGKALVPADWQLVRRDLKDTSTESSENGEGKVLAENVVSFDLDEAGQVIYTDGSAIYFSANGSPVRQCSDSLIESVVIVK